MKTVVPAVLAAGAVAAAVFVWNGGETASGQAPAMAAPRAMPVDVTVVEPRPIRLWADFSARLTAVDEVELRPQVSGAIVEVRFRDGERVKTGDVLFVIDPRPYRASVTEAEAQLAAAGESYSHARKDLERARSLVKKNAISERVLDDRSNAFLVAQSEVDAAKARLARARIDLDHAFVKAPISGRVSRAEITVGNLVQAGASAPVLTSIVSDTEIYADFEVDERTYFDFVRSGARSVEAERAIPVKLRVGGANGIAVDGHIHTFDNRIDPATGTIRARALFSNETGALLPGMFAQVRLGAPEARPAILLTESAILTDQDRKFVYLIDDQGKAAYRQITLGASVGSERIVATGLSAGDRVITSNLMLIRPSVPVAPKTAPADAPAKDTAAR